MTEVEDVLSEIKTITRRLTWTCVGIAMVAALLSGYLIWAAARTEKEPGSRTPFRPN